MRIITFNHSIESSIPERTSVKIQNNQRINWLDLLFVLFTAYKQENPPPLLNPGEEEIILIPVMVHVIFNKEEI